MYIYLSCQDQGRLCEFSLQSIHFNYLRLLIYINKSSGILLNSINIQMQVSIISPNPAANAVMMDSMRQSVQRQSMAYSMSSTQLNRSCTDILCLALYGFLVLTCVAICSTTKSDTIPGQNFPRDFDHNLCAPPFRYLYTPTSDQLNSVCVNLCPLDAGIPLECQQNSLYSTCPVSIEGLVRDEQFHLCYLVGNEISQPRQPRAFLNLILEHSQLIIKTATYVLIFSLVLLLLTLAVPELMAYATIMLLEILLLALSVLCFYRYFTGAQSFINTYMPFYFKSTRFLLVIAAILFIAAIISLLTIFYRLAQIRFIAIMLKVSKQCILQNLFIPFIALFLGGLYIGVFYLNMKCLNHVLSLVNFNFSNHLAHDQIETKPIGLFLGVIWFIQFMWTHGVLISFSHFVFETWSTFWYYNHLATTCGGFGSFTLTLRLIFYHFGTIIFGSIYTYYSQSIANIANNLEYDCINSPAVYNSLCCLHNCCCRYLSVYSYIQTALKSYPFWPANLEMYNIRVCMSRDLRRVYMLGTYYTNSAKYLAITLGVVLCYFNLRWNPDIFTNLWNIIPPILVIAMLSAQISTCFLDGTGLISDTVLLNYYMQFQFYRANMVTAPMSCPPQALLWIQTALNTP